MKQFLTRIQSFLLAILMLINVIMPVSGYALEGDSKGSDAAGASFDIAIQFKNADGTVEKNPDLGNKLYHLTVMLKQGSNYYYYVNPTANVFSKTGLTNSDFKDSQNTSISSLNNLEGIAISMVHFKDESILNIWYDYHDEQIGYSPTAKSPLSSTINGYALDTSSTSQTGHSITFIDNGYYAKINFTNTANETDTELESLSGNYYLVSSIYINNQPAINIQKIERFTNGTWTSARLYDGFVDKNNESHSLADVDNSAPQIALYKSTNGLSEFNPYDYSGANTQINANGLIDDYKVTSIPDSPDNTTKTFNITAQKQPAYSVVTQKPSN